jgi:hypothetical protein
MEEPAKVGINVSIECSLPGWIASEALDLGMPAGPLDPDEPIGWQFLTCESNQRITEWPS